MSRITAAGEKFGGKALEGSKILEEAFGFLKELLIKVKQTQVGHFSHLFVILDLRFFMVRLLLFEACGFSVLA